MTDTTCHMSISLDGFVAGPDQSREHPLGKRGQELHGWHLGDERANDADETATSWLMRPRGAYVMGRNMFGPVRGGWDEDWRGWWGDEPPFRCPVLVLTRREHPSIDFDNGTRFEFLVATPEEALARARAYAGDRDIRVGGGVTVVRDFLRAGLVDRLHVGISPIVLGRGLRLWDELVGLDRGYTVTSEVAESGVVHVTFAR